MVTRSPDASRDNTEIKGTKKSEDVEADIEGVSDERKAWFKIKFLNAWSGGFCIAGLALFIFGFVTEQPRYIRISLLIFVLGIVFSVWSLLVLRGVPKLRLAKASADGGVSNRAFVEEKPARIQDNDTVAFGYEMQEQTISVTLEIDASDMAAASTSATTFESCIFPAEKLPGDCEVIDCVTNESVTTTRL